MAWRAPALMVMACALLVACGPAATAPGAAATAAAPTPVSFPAGAPAQTTFTDPTQNAFTIAAPQGWTMKGGVQQPTPTTATPWVTATSPDGATMIIIGDPSIPPYVTPDAMHAQGGTAPIAAGLNAYVEPYETGAQFAQDYATRAYGQACTGMQLTGTQAEPGFVQLAQANAAKLAAEVGVPPAQVQYDGGSATFTCQANGATQAVGVIAVTGLSQAGASGVWSVNTLIAYRTPAASQAQTDQLARAMRTSFQPNPQWEAQMVALTRQQLASMQQTAAAGQAALTQQEAQESAMLQAQGQATSNLLNAEHAATMDQLNAQGAEQSAAFAQQQYNQETGQQAEMRYINNQQCVQWADAAQTRCAVTAPD
jgi:hypothetical protein